MRPEGEITRGTTSPSRLRRVDRWITQAQRAVLRASERPLLVDLGFGASPVTTVELYRRVRVVAPDAQVVGLEIDPERVAAARRRLAALRAAGDELPGLSFGIGGFELPVAPTAGACPRVQRAAPVPGGAGLGGLVAAAGRAGSRRRPRGGHLRRDRPPRGLGHPPADPGPARPGDGTREDDAASARGTANGRGAALITFSARLASVERPSDLAERLPKTLIHRNVPGEPVHAFLRDFDRAWDRAAPYSAFGPRQRWLAAVSSLSDGWPVLRYPPYGGRARWRLGEVTLPWAALAPAGRK